MDKERSDHSEEPFSFEDVAHLLEWAMGKPEPKDEFDEIIEHNYGRRVWRWNLTD